MTPSTGGLASTEVVVKTSSEDSDDVAAAATALPVDRPMKKEVGKKASMMSGEDQIDEALTNQLRLFLGI